MRLGMSLLRDHLVAFSPAVDDREARRKRMTAQEKDLLAVHQAGS